MHRVLFEDRVGERPLDNTANRGQQVGETGPLALDLTGAEFDNLLPLPNLGHWWC